MLFLVHVHGDAAAVVDHRDRIAFVDHHVYMAGIAGQGLVYGVVHHLIHQMVQTFGGNVAYVHGRTFAHGLQTFKHLDGTRAVVLFFFFFVYHL